MSYAASKQNSENRIDLPEDVLRRVGKHLNESIDTREYIEAEKRIVNIQEAERVLRYLPPEYMVIHQESKTLFKSVWTDPQEWIQDYYDLPTFLERLGFQNMKKVLENDFIAGWKRMNLYDRVTEYVLLLETFIDSIDTIDQKQRCGVLLKLQLDLLKRTLCNLDRVHAAYHNAVPLVNNKVTPKGSYDAIYLTKELFVHTAEINETYARLKGHIGKHKEQIGRMFRINITDCHMTDTRNKCISHSNGFRRVSVDYERDLRLYESLVIKQPLHRLNREIVKSDSLKKTFRIKESLITVLNTHTNTFMISRRFMDLCLTAYHDTYTTDIIKMYLDDLRKEKRASKLFIAGHLYAYNVVQLIDNFIERFQTNREHMSAVMLDKLHLEMAMCKITRKVKQLPLLRAWFLKMSHYFNITTDANKSEMEDYFMIKNHNSPQARLVRGDDELLLFITCHNLSLGHFPSPINVSRRQITSYKKTLDTLLHKIQLDGTLFRYVNLTLH